MNISNVIAFKLLFIQIFKIFLFFLVNHYNYTWILIYAFVYNEILDIIYILNKISSMIHIKYIVGGHNYVFGT